MVRCGSRGPVDLIGLGIKASFRKAGADMRRALANLAARVDGIGVDFLVQERTA